MSEADVFARVLEGLLVIVMLALWDELNVPAKKPKPKSRGGKWTQDEAQGEKHKR